MGERDRQPSARNRAAIFGPLGKPCVTGAPKSLTPKAHPKRPSSSMKIVALDALVLGGLSLLPYCRISHAARFVLHFH